MHPTSGILSLTSRRNFHNSHISFSMIIQSTRTKSRKTFMHVFELGKNSYILTKRKQTTQNPPYLMTNPEGDHNSGSS